MSLLFDCGDTQNALSLVAKNRSFKGVGSGMASSPLAVPAEVLPFLVFLKLALQESVRAISTARLNTSP